MQCARCGAVFEGRFCPSCGAPASEAAVLSIAAGWPCPRCGTLFRGNFCPRCGLSTSAWAYRPPPAPSSARSVLSVLWTLAVVSFLVFAALSFAGLAAASGLVVPGIQGIRAGGTANGGLDLDDRNWTFDSWGSTASDQYLSSGGNPGGFLEMRLPGSGARGFWYQPFTVEGAVPFTARITLNLLITGGLADGRLIVDVAATTGPPRVSDPTNATDFQGPTAWTALDPIAADAGILSAGTYFLKIAFVASATTGPVSIGIDNVVLSWATRAYVFFYVPAPLPEVLFVSQNQTLFLSYFAFLVTVTLLAGAYHAIRERVPTWEAFRAPLTAIGPRLRSRSAWIAVAQTWMAVTFFQVVFILLVTWVGIEPTTPIELGDPATIWVLLFELANAGVYEELAFRALLIGAPMAIGSLVLRAREVNRAGGRWNGPASASRHIAGAWRYLVGGTVRRSSAREALAAAWALLFASSILFGLAHFSGWGSWKVVPSFVAGLGFGYLFLRHGIGAAILAHFVNDYAFSLYYEGIGGISLEVLLTLVFIGLTVAGSGFFLWYAIEAWRHARDLLARFRPTAVRIRPPAVVPRPEVPMPPSPSIAAPPAEPPWATPPMAGPPPIGPLPVPRDPMRIPRDYTPTYRAPPYGYPPVRFQCPSCGWVEARYDAGRFMCARCGRTA